MFGVRNLLMCGVLWAVAATNCPAHDLKVMPDRGALASGETAVISISWGHVLPFDTPLDAKALERYELRSPNGTVVPLKTLGVSRHSNPVLLNEKGVYQATATRKPSVFTVVVDGEGRHRHHRGPKTSVRPEDGAIDHAARSHQYTRALLTSGRRGNQTVPAEGLPLEIVPLEAPAAWHVGRDLHFRALFQGRPVANEEVVVSVIGVQPTGDAETDTDKDVDSFGNPTLLTDDQGIVTVSSGPSGLWVLRVRVRKPAEESFKAEYDYESYTATVVLEVTPFPDVLTE